MRTPNRHRRPAALPLATLLTLLTLLTPLPARGQANANPPGKMTFQGFLTDAATPPVPLGNTSPENKSVIFKIYKNATGTANTDVLWAEQQVVTVDKGHFSVLLGEGSALSGFPHSLDLSGVFVGADASERYIGLTIDSAEITPRIQFFAAPYAQLARAANSLTSGAVFNGGAQIGTGVLEFGAGVSGKQGDAGKVGYELFTTGALDILGAGLAGSARTVKLWDNAVVSGSLGVGTSPAKNLHVKTSDGDFAYTSDAAANYLQFGNGSFSTGKDVRFTSPNAGATWMTIKSSGNVGIGTTDPVRPLDITSSTLWNPLVVRGNGGTDAVVMGNSSGRAQIGAHSGALNAWAHLTLQSHGGNLGIGTGDTVPAAKLHLSGGMRIEHQNTIEFGGGLAKEVNNGKIGYQTFSPGLDIVGAGADAGSRKVTIHAQGGTTIWGNVGMGTSTPAVPLHVVGGVAHQFLLEAVLGTGGASDQFSTRSDLSHSIVANQRIRAASFDVESDARIKQVTGRVSGQESLQRIRQLDVKDYVYIDQITHGNRTQRGLIAQEVSEVLPEAVGQSKGVIPNIYAPATSYEFDASHRTLSVELKNPHLLETGDVVSLILGDAPAEMKVLEVPSASSFVVAATERPQRLFVIGKQVQDFRTVDYDLVFTTGISALQELDRQVEELKKSEARMAGELAEKTERMAELEAKAARVDSLERQVAELTKLVAALVQGQAQERLVSQNAAAPAGQ